MLSIFLFFFAIVGAGAGIGLSAKFLEAGGADLIITVHNSGRFRIAGRGSLAGLMPYGNANDMVIEMAAEVLPVVRETPVLAGVCATGPFRQIPRFLGQLRELGFAGVQNFPTVGLIDGEFRMHLEQTGMGYDAEIDMIRAVHELGLLTTPYVFHPDEAKKMADAGADIAPGKTLDDCVRRTQEIQQAATSVNPEVIILCHGGPIAAPEDADYVLARTKGIHGFYGASSMERLPVEQAIADITRKFKGLSPGRAE
ncbi:TIM-barrel enzyme family protein [Immersiella caudata]|uniref:TIM-barrel enzyme family protein n=1 Tax=Immersiella caudata TaxID=314043 RepID=A0AA39X5W1_9PEZI|nr:TIM-barrel enzyme family protein [Immersiella caudata]